MAVWRCDKHIFFAKEVTNNIIIIYAAKNDDVELGKAILNKASSEEFKQSIIDYQATHYSDGFNTCLHQACTKGSIKFLKWILSIISEESPMFTIKNYYGLNPLMLTARYSNLKCAKLLLNKLKNNKKILNDVLKQKSGEDIDAVGVSFQEDSKKSRQISKLILSYYNEDEVEAVFLPAIQLGDIKLTQRIWDKTNGDKELQRKILSLQNKDKYNAFQLAAQNGQYESLNWLLSLNDDNKEGDEEDEANLTQQHPISQSTPLILCVQRDIRKKSEDKEAKVLSDEEKENYFKCVQLIFSKVSNKRDLVLSMNSVDKTAMTFACDNANLEV